MMWMYLVWSILRYGTFYTTVFKKEGEREKTKNQIQALWPPSSHAREMIGGGIFPKPRWQMVGPVAFGPEAAR